MKRRWLHTGYEPVWERTRFALSDEESSSIKAEKEV
jgi:hypothetical protein